MLPRSYSEQAPSPDKLVATHMGLARRIAWHVHGRVSGRVEIDDLLQVAYLGLLDAAQRYVAQPGTPFAAYAGIRIRGAVMDHLRNQSNLARATLRMTARIRQAEQALAHALMRQPNDEELARALDMPLADLARWRRDIDSVQTKSLDDVYSDHLPVFGDGGPGAEDLLMQDTLRLQLRDAIARLPEREALVLQLYFVEDLNVYEVAEVLGVTTGRISQIKKAAIERLRRSIAEAEAARPAPGNPAPAPARAALPGPRRRDGGVA